VDFPEAAQIVYGLPLPHTHRKRGRSLYQHIIRNRPEALLELGTARGGSAVFIAAALQANGTGHLTSVDSLRWQRTDPSPHEVLEKAGLRDWVTLDANYSTYTWFLKAEIEKRLGRSATVAVGKERTAATRQGSAPMRWNPEPEDVQKSVAQLVLTIVEFLRRLMERQAIRRMEQKTLTKKEVEAVGAALMTLEQTVRAIGEKFGLTPEDLNLDLGPLGTLM